MGVKPLQFSAAHPISLKLRPIRAGSGGRRRGLLGGLLLWNRLERGAARQQCRHKNQHTKLFNHDIPFLSEIMREADRLQTTFSSAEIKRQTLWPAVSSQQESQARGKWRHCLKRQMEAADRC
jgi:hypothetical protein